MDISVGGLEPVRLANIVTRYWCLAYLITTSPEQLLNPNKDENLLFPQTSPHNYFSFPHLVSIRAGRAGSFIVLIKFLQTNPFSRRKFPILNYMKKGLRVVEGLWNCFTLKLFSQVWYIKVKFTIWLFSKTYWDEVQWNNQKENCHLFKNKKQNDKCPSKCQFIFNVYWFFPSVENVFCVQLDWWSAASRKLPTHF